jgi:hypothetical protein
MKTILTLACMVLLAPAAQATPITVSAGDFVVFNFDLTNENPPPPYLRAGMDVQLSGLDFETPPCSGPDNMCQPLDQGEWKLWTEPDGTGINFDVFPGVNLNSVWNWPEMNDGVFSATLQVTAGSITVDPIACGIAPDGTGTSACPRVPPPPAPEPATVTLMASAAVAAILRRRLSRSASRCR